MEETINITISSLKSEIKGNLAMVGKRLPTKDGSTLFTSTTLSKAEDDYLASYIRKGVSVFLGEFAPIVTGYEEDDVINITFRNPRVNEAKRKVFKQNFISYVDAFCELKVYGLSLNEEARRNMEEEMKAHLSAAIKLIFTPDPPEQSGKTLLDMKGEVILDNKPVVL